MKIISCFLSLASCLLVLMSSGPKQRPDLGIGPALASFRTEAPAFATAAEDLRSAVKAIDKQHPRSLYEAREALKRCRAGYKKIEFFLDYFFKSAALIYNAPAKIEIEEPYMEFQEPIGLQVIEGLLFDKNVYALKDQLIQQAAAVQSSAADLTALLYGFEGDDAQLLESIRLHFIKVITLGITGFDAPLLKSGISEAAVSMESLHQALQPFLSGGSASAKELDQLFVQATGLLKAGKGFDQFDRLQFIKQFALPIQQKLGLLIRENGLQLNTTDGVLNYDATDLFAADAVNLSAFPQNAFNGDQQALVALGKQLFFDTRLSGNQQVSCASCHRPEYYFSEPQEKSSAFDGHSFVKRNAPTLLYSAYQYEQFWDGRAKSLEQQVQTVIDNTEEMNGHEAAAGLLQKAPAYRVRFDTLFARQADTMNISGKIALAIAAYIRQLNPMNARFDQYLRGNDQLLSASEKNGFNLFMGKAQCGTCHFAPLFNGLVPPLYNLSELEVIGTLKTDKLDRPKLDDDKGRIEIFPIEYYDRSFKTPTVRNVSATAPYMHNGAFHTLYAVVEFYNKGGAVGLGLPLPNQTLSALPLQLSKQEVKDVVNFLHALKDSIDLSTLKTYNNR